MSDMFTRREFGGLVAAGAAAAGLPARADDQDEKAKEEIKKTRSYNPEMQYRRLGKTGLWVSAVCMGGHWKRIDKVGAAQEPAFSKNRAEVINRCLEVGINYIDACAGNEVMAYSKALKGKREQMFFGFSWYEQEMRNAQFRKTEKLLGTLNKGLQQSGLEYVDLWRITLHERGSLHTDAEMEEAIKALAQAKKEGKCRFTGISCHDRPWIKKQVEKYQDVLQVIVTPYTADSTVLPKDSLFDAVKECGVGVFGIKPFASNSLFKGDGSPDSPQAEEDSKRARLAIRYILANPAISAPIPGLISVAQVDNVVKAVKEGPGLTEAEAKELRFACQEMWANLPPDYHWLREHRFV